MSKQHFFTKKKFLTLVPAKQHKEAARLLKALAQLGVTSSPSEACSIQQLQEHYDQICRWLFLPPLLWLKATKLSKERRALSLLLDRLHFHQRHEQQKTREDQLLDLSRSAPKEGAPFAKRSIYLDRIRSAHNIGSIARSCEAFRLGSFVFPPGSLSPRLNHPQAKRTSMGAAPLVPWSELPLAKCPRPWIALEQHPQSRPLEDYTFPSSPFTLILGNEEEGVSQEILEQVDLCLEIKLSGWKNSLNVACAFAICAQAIAVQQRV